MAKKKVPSPDQILGSGLTLIGWKCRGIVCWELLSFKCFSEYYMTLRTKERNFQKQPSVSVIVKGGLLCFTAHLLVTGN